MRAILLAVILAISPSVATAQDAPQSRHLADSPWPVAHRNPYAQGSTPLPGPTGSGAIDVAFLDTGIGASPWSVISEKYPDGSRAVWGASLTGLFKAVMDGPRFELVDVIKFDDRVLEFNGHWDLLIGAGNKVFAPDPKRRKIQRFTDADPRLSRSEIRLDGEFFMPSPVQGGPTQLQMSFDGWLFYMTRDRWLGAVRPDFSAHIEQDLSPLLDVGASQNKFAIDATGAIYIVDFSSMQKFRFDGRRFVREWRATYDFRGPGCGAPMDRRQLGRAVGRGEGCTGAGTTPTLIGVNAGDDKLVIVTDSHERNNMVAFWREEPPRDWRGLPGADRRLAAVTPLPFATWKGAGFTTQNSPSVLGYDIYVAQWAGFFPSCQAPSGVQMLRWDPRTRTMPIVWANGGVQINGVVTTSGGSDMIYGSGRDGCMFKFWGLDRQTGKVKFAAPLGVSPAFADQGNGPALSDDGSIVLGVRDGVIRVRDR